MRKINGVTNMITVEEAAHLAHYHPNHVRRLLRSGKVIGQKWGQTWMINRTSFRAYMQAVGEHERRGPKRREPHPDEADAKPLFLRG